METRRAFFHNRSRGRMLPRHEWCGAGVPHVYGLPAFSDTPYGRILSTKIVVFLLTLGVAGWQLMRLSPALKRQARTRIPGAAYTLLGRCAWYGRRQP